MGLALEQAGEKKRDADNLWLARALVEWLADKRVMRIAIHSGCASARDIGVVGTACLLYVQGQGPAVPAKILRKVAYDLLINRKLRRMVARLTLERQRAMYAAMPQQAQPPTSIRRILSELQELRDELRMEHETGIVRPW